MQRGIVNGRTQNDGFHTAERHWAYANAWLYRQMAGG